MRISDLSFGIDFKQDHLILTLMRKSLGKVRLVDFGIHPIPPESQKEEREAQLISLVNTFISKHQIHKEKVSISIPREKVMVRFIKLPIATKDNLRKVLEYEVSKFTPFEKGEIHFDYHILKEDKDWVHLFGVFVKKDEVNYYLSLLKKIGIQPLSIQIPSTAALNLFFYHEWPRESENIVLLDVTDSYFEMTLIQERNLTESFHLPLPSEGRELKMIETLERFQWMKDSLSKSNFFVYGLRADEGMLLSFREVQTIQKVSFPPLDRIAVEKGGPIPNKIYASIGTPLQGLAKTWMGLNLLPTEMQRKVRQFGKPLLIILTSLALLLSLTWGIGVSSRYRNGLKAVNAEIKKKRPEVEAVEKLQRQKEALVKEISELNKFKAGEISKIEILEELTKLLPHTVWIWNFKYNGKEIEISGFADSASDLIPLLDKSPLFEKVEFLSPVTKERERRIGGDKEKERFKIKMRLEGRS